MVKAQDFDSCISLVRVQLSQPEKSKSQDLLFSVIVACGEFYCFAVIFGLRRVVFASRVLEANIISLRNEVEQYHFCESKNITLTKSAYHKKLFDSEVFRNFADAFRAFRVCRQIRTGEMLEKFTIPWYNIVKKGGEIDVQ